MNDEIRKRMKAALIALQDGDGGPFAYYRAQTREAVLMANPDLDGLANLFNELAAQAPLEDDEDSVQGT